MSDINDDIEKIAYVLTHVLRTSDVYKLAETVDPSKQSLKYLVESKFHILSQYQSEAYAAICAHSLVPNPHAISFDTLQKFMSGGVHLILGLNGISAIVRGEEIPVHTYCVYHYHKNLKSVSAKIQ